jgi:hypothetical protein
MPERHKQHSLDREWEVPYSLDDPDTPPVHELIEEWDDDRIDDRDLIEFLREVAKIPVPAEITGMYERLMQSGWDMRLWHPIYVARATVWAYDRLEKAAEDDEDLSNTLSPKIVLNSAIVWDRG